MKKSSFCVYTSIILAIMSMESCAIYNSLLNEYKAAEERVVDLSNASEDNQYGEFLSRRQASSISMGITIQDGKLSATDSLEQMGEIINMIEYFLTELFFPLPKAQIAEPLQENRPFQSEENREITE